MSRGYVLTYDGQSSATACPEVIFQTADRELLPGVRDSWVEVPGLDGSLFYGEAAGDRDLSFDFTLIATSRDARRPAVRALASFVRKAAPKRLIIDNEPDRYWEAKVATSPGVLERAVILGRGTLRFRTGPYAQSVTTSETTAPVSAAPDFAVDVSASDVEVLPVIEVTFNANSPSGFVLTVGGVSLTYAGNIDTSDVKTISCLSATVVDGAHADEELATGVFNAATLDMSTTTGAFGTLGPDNDTIQLTGATGSVRVVWRERYL